MIDVYEFWLSLLGLDDEGCPCGVDGFRIDMAYFINDPSFWNEEIAHCKRKHPDRELLFLAECYGINNSVDLFERGFNGSYDDAFYKLLEHYFGSTPNGESVPFTPQCHPEHTRHSPLYDTFLQTGFSDCLRRLLDEYETALRTIPHPVFLAHYADNHDEGRGIYRFGLQAVKLMMELAVTTPHSIPFILTGQEFGAMNRPSIHSRFDLCDKGRQVVSELSIRWQDGVELEGNSFLRSFADRQELCSIYQKLFLLREHYPALQIGSYTPVQTPAELSPKLLLCRRDHAQQHLLCMVNTGATPILAPPEQSGTCIHGCSSPPFTPIFHTNHPARYFRINLYASPVCFCCYRANNKLTLHFIGVGSYMKGSR